MIDQERAERILNVLKNQSIDEKVKAMNEAREMLTKAFDPKMNDVQFAYSAMVVEQYYNLIREELQVKQIRIKADLGAPAGGIKDLTKKVAPKSGKKKPEPMDMMAMMAAFVAAKPNLEKKLEEQKNGVSESKLPEPNSPSTTG